MAIINVTVDNSTVVVSNGDIVQINIAGGGTTTIVAQPGVNIQNLKIRFIGDNESDTVIVDLSTFSSYGLDIDVIDYDPSDQVILTSAFNQYVDPQHADQFQFDYIGFGGVTFNGAVHAKDPGEKDFTSTPAPIIVCFCEGTVIETDLGPTPVEALKPGDLVLTRDNGLQPLRWIGLKRFDSLDLARHPNLRPVHFAAGSLGRDLPYRDLMVSPQHRMLVTGWRAELNFGEPEVLVPAIGMVNGRDVTISEDAVSVAYYHLLFDRHEIVTANGVPSESLHSGDMAMTAVGAELALILPDAPRLQARSTARPVARTAETAAVAA